MEHYNEKYQERYVEKTLENGLHVVIWQKKDYHKSFFMMGTPLGALDLKQHDQNQEYCFPAGVAHFLEHKMFEDENEDIMDSFAKMSCVVNAFTSYNETCYYFTTSSDFEKPLNKLLDFVQELKITKESVEKEKGIICQELSMYQQNSDVNLYQETFLSIFDQFPMRFDIGGDPKSVNAITLEDLELCYKLNYHPSKMILVGVCANDPNEVIQMIEKNQATKSFPKVNLVERSTYNESVHVARKHFEKKMDISIPKVNICFKMKGILDPIECLNAEMCFRIMLEANFSSLDNDYQKWFDEGLINDYFNFDTDFTRDYAIIMFYSETNKVEEFTKTIKEKLMKMKDNLISDETLIQLKKRYHGSAVKMLNNFDSIATSYTRKYFEKLDYFDSIDLIFRIDKDKLTKAYELLDVEEYATVLIEPNND
ncbi:MAG: pitrilysin family protein [Erysipelotrichaceae bacterium]